MVSYLLCSNLLCAETAENASTSENKNCITCELRTTEYHCTLETIFNFKRNVPFLFAWNEFLKLYVRQLSLSSVDSIALKSRVGSHFPSTNGKNDRNHKGRRETTIFPSLLPNEDSVKGWKQDSIFLILGLPKVP